MALPSSSVVLRNLSFAWPDGAVVIDGVSGAFGRGRTGLVGANGVGKSTLLRLIAGQLAPIGGAVAVAGTVDYLPQQITAQSGTTVADLLGITPTRAALRAIEDGSADPQHFGAVGDDWDVEERAVAALSQLGLPGDLDRPVTALSGGEAMLTAVTGVRVRRAEIALLDEPTNNLDGDARDLLYELVGQWRGTLLVVSHDLALLELMDSTAELRAADLTCFGGPYSAWRVQVEAEQEAARQTLRTAEQALRREKQERIKAEERIAHSERQGRKDREDRKFVPIVINQRRNAAEKSQGDRRGLADAKVAAARVDVEHAAVAVRDDDTLRIDVPDPQVPRGRRLVEIPSGDGRPVVLQGPERIALIGANGVGKTTLIRRLLPQLAVRVGYLPQRIDLDEGATVLEVVRAAVPGLTPGEVCNRLARLLLRGAVVNRLVATLSGGERFRVALARLVLADPPPELLILDEPTNNLDIPSVDHLIAALAAYRGGLLVVSHDRAFLDRLDLDATLRLLPDGVIRWDG